MEFSRLDLMMLKGFSEKQQHFTGLVENIHEGIIASQIGDSKAHPF